MPRVKSGSKERWQRRASAAGTDYQQGVQNPRRDWEQSTSDSSENWAQGVQQAVANNLFQTGVQRAGNRKWQQAASEKGAQRYPQGVAGAGDAYQQGIQPYFQTIEATDLPPRFPRGDERNIERVRQMAQALHQRKQELQR